MLGPTALRLALGRLRHATPPATGITLSLDDNVVGIWGFDEAVSTAALAFQIEMAAACAYIVAVRAAGRPIFRVRFTLGVQFGPEYAPDPRDRIKKFPWFLRAVEVQALVASHPSGPPVHAPPEWLD